MALWVVAISVNLLETLDFYPKKNTSKNNWFGRLAVSAPFTPNLSMPTSQERGGVTSTSDVKGVY
jgi:hypothetical protein